MAGICSGVHVLYMTGLFKHSSFDRILYAFRGQIKVTNM